MDLQVPVMSGMEYLCYILTAEELRFKPVVT